jgi:tetratricopeptide (TPR) repeat protein
MLDARRNGLRRLRSAAAAVGLFVATSLHLSAEEIDAAKLDHQCGPSVVFILATSSDGKEGKQGTGFIVSADGKMVTNHHVIAGAAKFVVRSADKKEIPVKAVLADDGMHDLAILQLEGKDLPALALADDGATQRGSRVVVIGNPLGFESTISDGLISAIRQVDRYGELYQITAPISHGSSGSPVLNAQGQVIGVATLGIDEGQALNFAVSARNVRDLLAHPRVVPGPKASDFPVASADLPSEATRKEDAQVIADPKFAHLRDLERAKTYPLMLADARALVQSYPQSAVAQRRLSDAFYYAAFYDDAVVAARKALALDPKSARAWNNLATLALEMKDPKAQMAAYHEGLKVAPTDVLLWLQYGEAISVSNPAAALDATHTALSLLKAGQGTDPESIAYALYADAAENLLKLGRADEAYEAALAGVKRDPKNPDSWTTMASCALAVKKYPHVRPYLEQALGLGAPQDYLYGILASSEEEQRHYDLALDALHRAHQANALNQDVLSSLVRVLLSRPTISEQDLGELSGYMNELQAIDPKLGLQAREAIEGEMRRRGKPIITPEGRLLNPGSVASAPASAPTSIPTVPSATGPASTALSADAAPGKPRRLVPEHAVALGGRKNRILGGPNPSAFTTDELPMVLGLGIGEVQLPDRHSLTYFHLDTVIDNETPLGAFEDQLSVEVRVLCVDGNGQSNVTKYTKKLNIASRGPQHVGLGGVYALDVIRQRNNNNEIPKNAYLAFKFHDKVFDEVLLGDFGGSGWWQNEDLVRPVSR